MASDSGNNSKKYNQSLLDWWDRLCHKVNELEAEGKELWLIAISRKMPRLIEWIEVEWIPSLQGEEKIKREEQLKKIREIGIISEHAIPFITSSKPSNQNGSGVAVIVMDDIMITGLSMTAVVSDIHSALDIKPYISSIFIVDQCKDLVFDNATFINKDKICKIPSDEIRSVVNWICDRIKYSSLPMELEFPAFHIENKYDAIKAQIKKEAEKSRYRWYEIEHTLDKKLKAENISVILEHELRWTLNHDYAKIRLFKKKEKSVLEVNAPRVINVYESQSEDLFKSKDYASVWIPIITEVKKNCNLNPNCSDKSESSSSLQHRAALTLAVWANYLFSLSVGMHATKETSLLNSIASGFELEEKDIALLLGKRNAQRVTPILNRIVTEKEEEARTIEKFYDTEMYLAPEKIKTRYKEQRHGAANNNPSIGSSLKCLWESHINPSVMNIKDEDLNLMSELGETILALEELLDYSHSSDTKAFVKTLNKEIDNGVDSGSVSPFYAEVEDSSGDMCWRRFYRGGSSSIL